jgi:transcriptional regulator with XRE-family HTH domain
MNSDSKYIVDEITRKRKMLGISQTELAERCGMPKSTIGRIENYSMNPSLDVFTSIMNELDVSFEFIKKKYMRIQGEELAYKTKKPVGIFVLTWRRVRDGIYSEEDKNVYLEVDKWFKDNMPEPPFY